MQREVQLEIKLITLDIVEKIVHSVKRAMKSICERRKWTVSEKNIA